ncbi:MAG TPA: hypothetical protein VNT55_09785 [Baekduia sp.]|nr:hypothetical protein [Baekduia sp.]
MAEWVVVPDRADRAAVVAGERAAGADQAVEAARQLAVGLDDDHDQALVQRLEGVVVGVAGPDLDGAGRRAEGGGRGDGGGTVTKVVRSHTSGFRQVGVCQQAARSSCARVGRW